MEKLNFARSVWGTAEDALFSPPEFGGPLAYTLLSPPEHGGSLAAALDSEESSEDSEDYISGLAEEIAQSMLQEDEEEVSVKRAPWGIGVQKPAWSSQQMASSPTSPQSTLAGVGGYNWEVRSPGGNMGSSGVSSPSTPQEGESRDVLYAELLRVKLEDQVKLASQQQVLSRQQQIIQRPTQALTTTNVTSPLLDNRKSMDTAGLDIRSVLKSSRSPQNCKSGGQAENYHLRAGSKEVGAGWGGPLLQTVYESSGGSGKGGGWSNSNSSSNRMRREESVKQPQAQQYHQFSLFASNINAGGNSIIMNHQNNNISSKKQEGMRAVFLGSPSSSRECGGTGVFLPRRRPPGSTHHPDSRRKPVCSTVLLPSHIVHALNLKVEDTLPSPQRRDFSSSSHNWRRNSPAMRSRPKDEVSSCYFPESHSMTLQEVAPDISLPSEWTY